MPSELTTTAGDPSVHEQLATARAPQRFHQLDGLRAVAVTLVVIHHAFTAPISGLLRAHGKAYLADLLSATTQSGVELFFVLSGVVLLRPYLRGRRPFAPGQYFFRRVQRLWPPYLAALIAEGVVVYLGTRWPTWFIRDAQRPTFSLLGWASQLGIVSFGWRQYNVAWWSLTIEVLFYMLVPVLIPLMAARRVGRLWSVALFFAVLGTAAAVLCGTASIGNVPALADRPAWVQSLAHWSEQGGHDWLTRLVRVDPATSVPYLALLNLLVYSPCFLLGMMIAKFDWPPKLGWVIGALGLTYLLAAIRFPWMNSHAGYGLFYGGIVMASFAPHGRLYRFLASDLMVWLGERSYSLFLIHFTVFALVNWLTSFALFGKDVSYFFVTRAVGIPGAMLAAMLLFWFVERHFARNLATANQFWPPLPDGRESDNS